MRSCWLLTLCSFVVTVHSLEPEWPALDNGLLTTSLSKRKELSDDWKYFQEPGNTMDLSHYDARFFKGELSYDEHRVVLRNLIRSYLSVTQENNIHTWLAHGTLLGWWWNGKIMPWDWDLDVQMTSSTLTWLGENMNQTEYDYVWNDDEENENLSTYIFDVNPHHVQKGKPFGLNVIDGRWIDISNGAFVDITAVKERDATKRPGLWICKDFHEYWTTDLFPTRQSEFEGLPATVPHEFEKILTTEYGARSIRKTTHEGHEFDRDTRQWVMS